VTEKPERNKGGKPKIKPELKKVVVAATMDQDVIEWTKEWAARRDRSFSWAINHFARERRNRELAEKHLGQRVVR
jgi:hypothetical protein